MSQGKGTIFTDLDGCLIRHRAPEDWNKPLELLPGTYDTLRNWWDNGYIIIITTGRQDCNHDWLEAQLHDLGIYYHKLITGIGTGPRFLINDVRPKDPEQMTAIAFNVVRDGGIEELKEWRV